MQLGLHTSAAVQQCSRPAVSTEERGRGGDCGAAQPPLPSAQKLKPAEITVQANWQGASVTPQCASAKHAKPAAAKATASATCAKLLSLTIPQPAAQRRNATEFSALSRGPRPGDAPVPAAAAAGTAPKPPSQCPRARTPLARPGRLPALRHSSSPNPARCVVDPLIARRESDAVTCGAFTSSCYTLALSLPSSL